MIDINFIRENFEKVKEGVVAKQLPGSLVDDVLELDKKRRDLLQEVEELRASRNAISSKQHEASSEAKEIKLKLKELEPKLRDAEEKFREAMLQIPNIPADDVKTGKDESENEIIRTWGEKKNFSFDPKDHVELGERLNIIDIERASKVSGARFSYLKGDGVLLEMALVNFALETLTPEGFVPVIPPALIKRESMGAMGYLEHGGEEDMFSLSQDNLILIGTSEQSIGPMHGGEILDVNSLPIRYVGYSPCFRREAGSYGKDTRGILRVHQFDKVEMFSFTTKENGDSEHEFLLSLEEKLFQALEIPYQVVKMCSGDLGAPAARKYDIEAWIPSQGKYREVTSTSTTTDFQSRRLNIRYQGKEGMEFVYMLNGTAFAIGRTIIAILENYQEEDGSVTIPSVLRKWMGKDKLSLK